MGEQLLGVSPATIFARPTADQIWLGPSQQEALSQLSRGPIARILLGPGSSGKTTLLNHLARREDSAVVVQLRGPIAGASGVLTRLLQGVGLDPWQLSVIEQRNLFAVFAQQRSLQGRRIVVSIDDAERIDAEGWDELERLSLLPDGGLTLILAANAAHGRRPALRALTESERAVAHLLPPLSDEGVAAYLDWRLRHHGLADLFTATAIRLLSRAAQGRFTAVDLIAQMALLLLRKRGGSQVDARILQEATRALTRRGRAEPSNDTGAQAVAALPPPGCIIATRDGAVHSTHGLGPRVLIGRSEHNDLCLPSPYLSRHHAVIVGTTDGYYIVDLNSVNGLLLNGRLVRRAVLRHGDLMGLGPFRLKVQIDAEQRSGNPIPAGDSLDDTAVMPPQPRKHAPVRIIK